MPSRGREYQPWERIPGTVYEVVRLIGAGGMGTVYDVEDTSIGKRYVLKTLHPQLGAREDVARRMQKEARTLARLNHSNIVEVITAGVTGDDLRLPFYVMERLNGQSLRVVLEKKGQLELPHACHIGIDLLDALDHAHDKGVIHRDVKPDNIFLHRTAAGVTVTKLLDFGILSLLDASVRETGSRFLGTLRYAAPEQLRGERPTPKVDVYAAGLVLYEVIAGRGPFDEEPDPHAVGAAHLHKPPPMLSTFASVAPELEEVIMAALAKDPGARPRDAFSFAASLRKLKRALSGARARDSTEDRATAVEVIGPESVPYVDVSAPSSDGPYVISPARERRSSIQTSLPKTTIRGVIVPTLGPPLEAPVSNPATVTTSDVIDRMATTNSFVPDTMPSPKHGTVPFALGAGESPAVLPTPAPSAQGESPFRWPDERVSATSEALQVQTLSVAPPRSLRSAARLVAGIAALAALLVGVLVLAWRPFAGNTQRAFPARATGAAQPSFAVSATAAVSSSAVTSSSAVASVQAVAPAQAPVASGDPKSTAAAPGAVPPRAKPRPTSSATSKSIAPVFRPDRPGPGF